MGRQNKRKLGFTLIELIIVVAIIGLLAAALFVAIDPARRIGEARDAQRWSDISAILNAILTYTSDLTTLPTQVDGTDNKYYVLQGGGVDAAEVTNYACNEVGVITSMSLGASLVDYYLSSIPFDPHIGTPTSTTGYYFTKSAGGRITIGACEHYQSGSLEVQR